MFERAEGDYIDVLWFSTIWFYGMRKALLFLTFLANKLIKPRSDDNTDEIFEDVELENYHLVAQEIMSVKH